jgi:hypothetical protein
MDLTKYLKYLGALVLLLLVFGSGWWVRDVGAQADVQSLVQDHEIVLQEIEVQRVEQVSSLTKALAAAGDDREVLLDQLASMKSKPAEIKYITKFETVVEGTPTVVTAELPETHVFQLESGLAVAKFSTEPAGYAFDTADLTLTANLVVGNKDSALSLRAESDLEPGTVYELPVENLHVQHIRETKLFEPHILLGAGVSAGPGGIGYGPHVASSLFHPRPQIDLLAIRVGSTSARGTTRPSVGIDPVLYNVGDAMPVVTNIWLGAGASVDTSGLVSGTISIGAKL